MSCPLLSRRSSQLLADVGLSARHLREVIPYGTEHAVGLHQLLRCGESDPTDLGGFVAVADEDFGAVGGPGRHVDHGATGGWVDAPPDLVAGFDLEAGFFLDLADGATDFPGEVLAGPVGVSSTGTWATDGFR
jgi:hypothetical protein